MFAPTPELLTEWHMKYNALSERTWASVLGLPSSSVLRRHPNSTCKLHEDPNNDLSASAVLQWIRLADFYQWPHITQFRSWDHLMTMLTYAKDNKAKSSLSSSTAAAVTAGVNTGAKTATLTATVQPRGLLSRHLVNDADVSLIDSTNSFRYISSTMDDRSERVSVDIQSRLSRRTDVVDIDFALISQGMKVFSEDQRMKLELSWEKILRKVWYVHTVSSSAYTVNITERMIQELPEDINDALSDAFRINLKEGCHGQINV